MRLATAGFSLRIVILTPLALLAGCAPCKFSPVAWHPPPAVGFSGPFENVGDLALIALIPTLDGHGPETIVAGADGWLFTGLKDGRILRFKPEGFSISQNRPFK